MERDVSNDSPNYAVKFQYVSYCMVSLINIQSGNKSDKDEL